MRFGIRTKMLVFTAVAWTFIFGAYGVYVYKERIEETRRYWAPAVATSGTCVECHNTYPGSPRTDYEIGDVIGALEVVMPIESEMVLAMADIWRAIGYGFIGVGAMAFIGLWFIRRVITQPVLDVVDITRHLAMGDLTRTAAVKTSDEIGELARTTNEVGTNLHRMIEDIRRTSHVAGSFIGKETLEMAFREASLTDSSIRDDSIVSRM